MIRSWNVLSRGWLAAVLLLPLLAFATAPALSPEARLIDVYRLIQAGRSRVAPERAEALARDVPLGVYFITSRLDPGQLQDFYGAGALPLNYPKEYDRRQGKTGHGIWLHGVPQQNFARSPQSTDGCVVLANDDMQRLLHDVAPRSTPALITQAIQWVTPVQAGVARQVARWRLEKWRTARSSGKTELLMPFYSARFSNGTAAWDQALAKESRAAQGRAAELKDVSILSWRDQRDVLVVTFGLVNKGQRTGQVKRQYWGKEGGQWKIFFEGVIG